MKKLIIITGITVSLASAALASDLYKVTIHSNRDAVTLRSIGTDVVMAVTGGYLVLTDAGQSEILLRSNQFVIATTASVRMAFCWAL